MEAPTEDLAAVAAALVTVLAGTTILLSQVGFTLAEVGSCRSKNAKSVLFKSIMSTSMTAVAWYLIGYGMFSGPSPMAAGNARDFAPSNRDMTRVFRSFTYAITSGAVVSGSILCRARLLTFMALAAAYTLIVYPVVAHWAASGEAGWLSNNGFVDFAGGVYVHFAGGVAALVGAVMVGPRKARFETVLDDVTNLPVIETRTIQGFSPAIRMAGIMLLWIGWIPFNASAGTSPLEIGLAAFNTLLGGAASALAATTYSVLVRKIHDLTLVSNCLLAGCAAVTAGAGYFEPWAALLVGACGGLVSIGSSVLLLEKLHVDDVVDNFAVHGAPGALGALCVGLLHPSRGLFYGGGGTLLGVQTYGVCVIAAWTSAVSFVALACIRIALGGSLRVQTDDELLGLDLLYHDGYAFPDFGSEDVAEFNARKRMQLSRSSMRNRRGSVRGSVRSAALLHTTTPMSTMEPPGDDERDGKSAHSDSNSSFAIKEADKQMKIRVRRLRQVLNEALHSLEDAVVSETDAACIDMLGNIGVFERESSKFTRSQLAKAIVATFVEGTSEHTPVLASKFSAREVAHLRNLLRQGDIRNLSKKTTFKKTKSEIVSLLASSAEVITFVDAYFADQPYVSSRRGGREETSIDVGIEDDTPTVKPRMSLPRASSKKSSSRRLLPKFPGLAVAPAEHMLFTPAGTPPGTPPDDAEADDDTERVLKEAARELARG